MCLLFCKDLVNAAYTNKSYSTLSLEAPFCKAKYVSLMLILVSVAIAIVVITSSHFWYFSMRTAFIIIFGVLLIPVLTKVIS